ncbi:MAG: SDR family NAD(P)-dependent oxidoreductase, partial [Lachnospiraceae bacterium]|nr:SDR family NAD(P)-dependent oxidoreductase [Lachnospiraceae bacterium]
KAYVLSFSRALNKELKNRGIYVTAVCPGPVATEFFDIAEKHHKMPGFKRLALVRPEAVVEKAFRDSLKKKDVSVYSFTMNSVRFFTKVLPHSLFLYFWKEGKK